MKFDTKGSYNGYCYSLSIVMEGASGSERTT